AAEVAGTAWDDGDRPDVDGIGRFFFGIAFPGIEDSSPLIGGSSTAVPSAREFPAMSSPAYSFRRYFSAINGARPSRHFAEPYA
ncbi:MAG TPA: hypothetical protein PK529_10050, partial [Verrucomicrobiales bacterium]|nr:hypothetical protein [Verrucomicrobiales bacterium]